MVASNCCSREIGRVCILLPKSFDFVDFCFTNAASTVYKIGVMAQGRCGFPRWEKEPGLGSQSQHSLKGSNTLLPPMTHSQTHTVNAAVSVLLFISFYTSKLTPLVPKIRCMDTPRLCHYKCQMQANAYPKLPFGDTQSVTSDTHCLLLNGMSVLVC